MSYPHVTFRKSSKQDFETLLAFTKDSRSDNGRIMEWAVFNVFPHLKNQFDKDKHYKIKDEFFLRHFIREIYRIRQASMTCSLLQNKKRWEKIESDYFSLVDILFPNRKWPRGKYIAFGTIWGMYPRFLDDKTFQIPYWHRTPRYVVPVVIAHELLHFMFYDYFYKRYLKYNCTKYNFFVWHVSEIFNTIVQNSPAWLKYFKIKSFGYPEHQKIVVRMGRTWHRRSTWNIDTLVDEIIKEVQTQKLN